MLNIDIVPMDNKGCGYYRLIYPAQAMYNQYKVLNEHWLDCNKYIEAFS